MIIEVTLLYIDIFMNKKHTVSLIERLYSNSDCVGLTSTAFGNRQVLADAFVRL